MVSSDDTFQPMPDGLEAGDITFDDVVAKLSAQANTLIAKGADPDVLDKVLQDRVAKLHSVWETYGPQAFAPHVKPTVENMERLPPSTDAEKQLLDPTIQEQPMDFTSPQERATKLAESAAFPAGYESTKDIFKQAGNVALTIPNYIASGLRGIGTAVTTGDLTQAGADTREWEDQQPFGESKTDAGKAFNTVVSYPFEKLAQGAEYARLHAAETKPILKYLNPPLASLPDEALGTVEETAINAIPWLAGVRGPKEVQKITDIVKDPDIVSGANAGEEIQQKSKEADKIPIQPDLFSEQPELGLDMFSKESVPANEIEAKRAAAQEALNNKTRYTEETAALEQQYLDQQNELEYKKALKTGMLGTGAAKEFVPSEPRPTGQTDLFANEAPEQGQLSLKESDAPAPQEDAKATSDLKKELESRLGIESKANASTDVKTSAYPLDLGIRTNSDGSISIPKETLRVRTPEEVEPYTASPEQRATRQNAEDWLKKLGTADNVLAQMSKSPDAFGPLAERIRKAHDLSDTTIEPVNPEDLTRTKDGAAHALLPEQGSTLGMSFGDRVMLRGAGFIKNGLNKITVMHEIIHAAVSKAIESVRSGDLSTGPVARAVHELDRIRETLKDKVGPNLDPLSPMHHAFSNVHEFHAVTLTDPKAAEALRGINMGHVTVWDKYKDTISKIIGASRLDKPVMDRILELGNTVIDESGNRSKIKGKPEQAFAQHEPSRPKEYVYRPRVVNPLTATRNAVKQAGAMVRRAVTPFVTKPERDIRLAGEMAHGASQEAFRTSTQLKKDLNASIASEKADRGKVFEYLKHQHDPEWRAKNPRALEDTPKTKALLDNRIIPVRSANERAIAEGLVRNPSATKTDLVLAKKILDNPGYTMRQYQTEQFTHNLLSNAKAADALTAAGKPLSEPQIKAKATVDSVRNFIKDHVLYNQDTPGKSVSALRTQAKTLGIDVPKVLRGITDKATKKNTLLDAIQQAMPENADVDKAINNLVYEMAGLINRKSSPVASYYRGARLGDVLKTRSEIPPVIKALWGEIKDPGTVMQSTLMKQETAKSHLKQQASIRELGLNKYLFEDKLKAPPGFTEQLTGRGMGALKGLWTAPEIKNLLNSSLEIKTATQSLRSAIDSGNVVKNLGTYMWDKVPKLWSDKLVGNYKVYTLATDPGYYVMNAAGGPSIAIQNGVVNPAIWARGALAHVAEVSPNFLSALKRLQPDLGAAVERDLSNVTKAGMNESMMMGEVYDRMQAAKAVEASTSGGVRTPLQASQQLLGHVLGNIKEAGVHAMSLVDGWARRAALFHRIEVLDSFYKRQGTTKTPDEILTEAADWTKDTTITYNRAPALAKLSEKTGFSRALTYGVETVRNNIHSFVHGFSDFKRGMDAQDPILMGHGIKQILGAGAAASMAPFVISSAVNTMLSATGITSKVIPATDERQKFLQEPGGRFAGERVEELLDPKNPNPTKNKYFWAPGDRNDYNYQISQPIHVLLDALTRQRAGEKINWEDEAKNAFGAFTGVIFANALPNRLIEIATNKTPGWEKNQAPEKLSKDLAWYTNTFGMSVDTAQRMVQLENLGRPGVVKNIAIANESQGSSTMKTLISLGLGITKVPADTGLVSGEKQSTTSGRVTHDLVDSKKALTNVITSSADFSPDTIEKAYKQSFVKSYEALKSLHNAYTFAKANSVSDADVLERSTRGGLPKQAIGATYLDTVNPAAYLYQDFKKTIENQIQEAMDDPSKQQTVIDRYVKRMGQLQELTLKYSKLTPDQMEAMR